MTMLVDQVYTEVLRFLYAFSIRWQGVLTQVVLLALAGTFVLAAWRLRDPARKSPPRSATPSPEKRITSNHTPRRASA